MLFGVESCQRPLENLSLSSPFSSSLYLLKKFFKTIPLCLTVGTSLHSQVHHLHSLNSLKVYPMARLSKVWLIWYWHASHGLHFCLPPPPESFFVTGSHLQSGIVAYIPINPSGLISPSSSCKPLVALHLVIYPDLLRPIWQNSDWYSYYWYNSIYLGFSGQYKTGISLGSYSLKAKF